MQQEGTISHLGVLRCGISNRLRSARGLGCAKTKSRRAANRDNEFSPPDVDCHVTLPWGSFPCNGETLPRFDRAVCGYFMLGGQPKTCMPGLGLGEPIEWTFRQIAISAVRILKRSQFRSIRERSFSSFSSFWGFHTA
jgi:hypothetical protein